MIKQLSKIIILGALVAGGVAAVAAPGKPAGAAGGISGESAKIDVEEIWKSECLGCHGKNGKGETRAGRRAGAKDFTDPEYQESFSDEKAFKSIKEGLDDENGKELMQPFGEDLSDAEIKALVEHIRREFDPKQPRDLSEAALKKE